MRSSRSSRRSRSTLGLDGVVDATGKSGDVNVSVTLGDTPIEAEIRYGGGKSWIQIDGKWYDLPADALSSTTGQSLPDRHVGEQSRRGQDSRRDRRPVEAARERIGLE